ncbi:ATP-grasp domain-containing protein [Haloarchaeobius sp. TZWWS8]|uniref:ATP-grasp domain-containing protein n=1 Tax=Haloarchaeobius sp. TZWWS8 TaxID=3446121 RepID=UPI003EB99747
MTRVAFATSAEYAELTAADQRFAAALSDRGVAVDPAVWTDESVDWTDYDAVVVRSCWDYHTQVEAFSGWINSLADREVPLYNAPSTIHWNTHKFYLRDLEARGVETVPTAYVRGSEQRSLEAVLDEHDWREAVVKPAVSIGGADTWRTDRSRADSHQERFDSLQATADLLVQRFVPEITEGEWSFVFADGEYSHAVLKEPGDGEFRVHEHYGGSYAAAEPSDALVRQATEAFDAALDELGQTPLYARVDGVDVDGTFVLVELELVEPSLFFDTVPAAAGTFADAVRARLD